jgi:uracil-DNA glycosylase family 4
VSQTYARFTEQVQTCRECHGEYFAHDPRPVFLAEPDAKIMIVGQAPGRRVHDTGLPFNDPSGDTLREWLHVTRDQFYDPHTFAIIPTALCFPGTERGKGDLPPPPVCAPKWHPGFLKYISPEVTLLVGAYAQRYYLNQKRPVSEIVSQWPEHLESGFFPLPHPSPRNRKWLGDRPWFFKECVPALREIVREYLP